MDKNKFTIKDYHAISNAEITLDGITVIAGINGCGKSTISRWLDAYINFSNKFDFLVAEAFINKLNREQRIMGRVLENIYYSDPKIPNLSLPSTIESIDPEIHLNAIYDEFRINLKYFCKIIRTYAVDAPKDELKWIMAYLGDEDNLFGSFIDNYEEARESWAKQLLAHAIETSKSHAKQKLFDFIRVNGDEDLRDIPEKIQFEENGMDLINSQTFRKPLGLSRAIYYDSPFALTVKTINKYSWNRLQNYIYEPLPHTPDTVKKLILRIRRTIGGEIILKSDELRKSPELRYKKKDSNLDIPVNQTATGIKSFAIILRLLENGYIDEDTMLIIDEPEVHLHPEWIVEFARLLVLIHKEIGTKILIASHNPDMIAAIHSISMREGLEGDTRFYQALPVSNDRYNFKDLGTGIEGIFESFNIALSRIKEYGS